MLEETLRPDRKDSGEGVEIRRKEELDRGLEEYESSLKKRITEHAEKEKVFKEKERQVSKSLKEA